MTLDLEVIAKALLEGERFSVAGPDGPRGERGEQGPAGFDGVEGRPGEKGDKGDKGDPGEQGPPGQDGKDGEDGEDGEPGKKGDRGLRGEKGTTGDRGPQGRDGRIGPQGVRGPAGRGGNLGGGSSSSGGGAPSGPAGGDLSGTYPNPGVVDDSHSHTAATAPGGLTVTQERVDGLTLAFPPSVLGPLTWGHQFGDALLDYTDPERPTVIAEGTYNVSAYVFPNGDFNSAVTASYLYIDLELDADDNDWDVHSTAPLSIGSEPSQMAVHASHMAKLAAGAVLVASVIHDADVSMGMILRATVVRMA